LMHCFIASFTAIVSIATSSVKIVAFRPQPIFLCGGAFGSEQMDYSISFKFTFISLYSIGRSVTELGRKSIS